MKKKKPKEKAAPRLRTCRLCQVPGGTGGCGFRERSDRPGAPRSACRDCEAAQERQRYDERVARTESDYESLKPEDFDVGVGNDVKGYDKDAAKQKRQEYSRQMGELADALVKSGGDPEAVKPELGSYVARLAEQERRFRNRRLARTVSLHVAHEALHLRLFKQACGEYLNGRVEPSGYALRAPDYEVKRSAILHLSDLHLGASLSPKDNPRPHGAVEEARALEFVTRQLLDFKPQYRETTEAVLIFNGDLIEGKLQHSLLTGDPLVEQKVIFWRHARRMVQLVAAAYKKVRVVFRPGNHGRDTVVHPGRATSSKWDGHEWEMGYALMCMCDGLRNVEWDLGLMPYAIVDLYGSKLLVSHADTEPKIGDPDSKAKENAASLDRLNSTLEYGCTFDAACFGHYHKGRYIPGRVKQLFNAALIPSNGHARSSGYVGEPLGQWLWEAVEGHPVGDVRFLEVTPSVLRDEKLGTLLRPFRFGDHPDGAVNP